MSPTKGEPTESATKAPLQLLIETGLLLASERNPDVIVQAALDAGLKLSNAQFGAFFYNNLSDSGEVYQLYEVSGVAAEAFSAFPLPRPTEIFSHTFEGRGTLRSGDVTQDPRYGKNPPLTGMPPGHLPVRSYLAVPVSGREGQVLGTMLYGHEQPNVFTETSESLVATVAAQAAVAIENARLAEGLSREIALADAARALQRSTADRLTQVLEATTDGVLLLDREWRFTYVNPYANGIVAPGRDLAGTKFWDLFPNDVNGPLHRHYARAMQHGETVEFTEFYPPLKMWAQVRAFPTPEGIAIFFQDVTPRKEAERQQLESARRLRQALDAGQLGTWSWNKETDLLDLDERAAQILNAVAHVPITRTALRASIVFPADLSATPESLSETLDSKGYVSEYRVDGQTGQRWVSSKGLPTLSEDGLTVTGMTGTVQDISAQKTQEAMLRQTEKLAATGRMAATIAHEINNPLEAVTNLIYLSKTDPAVPKDVQHFLELADAELARVSQIAQQTLGFYRDTSHPVDIDLSGLLHGVADLFSRKLHSRNLRIDLDVHDNLRIFGLQGEVRQVFSNLMVNAIDASSKGTIRVRARPRWTSGREGVAVMICDEGGGIPHAIRHKLFTPFFTTKESIGTGLGLWVTRGIVEKTGGRVGFRSRTETPTGTVFRVFLPAAPDEKEISAPLKTTILQ